MAGTFKALLVRVDGSHELVDIPVAARTVMGEVERLLDLDCESKTTGAGAFQVPGTRAVVCLSFTKYWASRVGRAASPELQPNKALAGIAGPVVIVAGFAEDDEQMELDGEPIEGHVSIGDAIPLDYVLDHLAAHSAHNRAQSAVPDPWQRDRFRPGEPRDVDCAVQQAVVAAYNAAVASPAKNVRVRRLIMAELGLSDELVDVDCADPAQWARLAHAARVVKAARDGHSIDGGGSGGARIEGPAA